MQGAPDEFVDAAKLHAADLQRAMQRAELAKTRRSGRLRLIFRRIIGRGDQSPHAGPAQH